MEGEEKKPARQESLVSPDLQFMVRGRAVSVCASSFGAAFAGTDLRWYL